MDSEHRRHVNWRNDLQQYEIVEWPPEVQPNSLQVTVIKICLCRGDPEVR